MQITSRVHAKTEFANALAKQQAIKAGAKCPRVHRFTVDDLVCFRNAVGIGPVISIEANGTGPTAYIVLTDGPPEMAGLKVRVFESVLDVTKQRFKFLGYI